LFSLFFIITFGIPLLIIESTFWFWILGAGLGIFFGPVQSASRSMMVRISKPEKSSQMFGLFAFSGKATAFVGPWLVSFVVLTYGSQRLALATVLPFLIIGAFLMLSVREPAGAIKDSD
jgi:UMF1 family MFS transporter